MIPEQFRTFAKKATSAYNRYAALDACRRAEYERYRWQEEIRRWKTTTLCDWSYDDSDQEDLVWGEACQMSRQYNGLGTFRPIADELFVSSLKSRVCAATSIKEDSFISFDDTMGFGGGSGL